MTVFRPSVGCIFLALIVVFGCGSPADSPQDDADGPAPKSPTPPAAEPDVTVVEPVEPSAVAPPTTALEPLPEPTAEAPEPATPAPGDSPNEASDAPIDLAAAISGSDREARLAAIEQLESEGPASVAQMLDLLDHATADVRRGAIFYLLDRFDPADPSAEAALTAALGDTDALVRTLAISAMRRLGPNWSNSAVDALLGRLDVAKEEPNNRAAVARLLGSLESNSPSVLASATKGLSDAVQTDPDRSVRSAALMSLAKLAPPADLIAVCSTVLTNDREASVRALAASRLARLGADAAPAAEGLAGAMEDPSEAVRSKAAEALVGLGADALPHLTAKLKSSNATTRKLAIYSLIALGRAAKPAEPALQALAQDPDPQVRELAQMAIRRLQVF